MTLKTTSEWVELISQSELPAITSTAKMLDGFSNDDKSSLPNLSKAILHDQGLSSCVLKVANSAQRINVNKVSTVSRAAVVLGIRSVKNICLTVKLVDSLFAHKNLDENVHDALMQLMANSFYAGMLAKMMVPKYSEETQEEVYLAAMLYRLGETAFLSKGGESASKLVEKRKNEKDNELFDFYCEKLIGTNFHELTLGLVTKWRFSDLLLKSLDEPETRTDEV
ncbi:MAG: HDOD domain-containing protein, partial [Colwellia sp.]